jgi:hypothetical protein
MYHISLQENINRILKIYFCNASHITQGNINYFPLSHNTLTTIIIEEITQSIDLTIYTKKEKKVKLQNEITHNPKLV